MRANELRVGMRVRVLDPECHIHPSIPTAEKEVPGTIVEYEDDNRLYKVHFDTPLRGADAGHVIDIVYGWYSAWYSAHRLVPDTARMRDERIKAIMP